MKFFRSGFLFIGFVIAGMALHAQTADEIVNKYIDAIGGKEKLSQMKSLQVESAVEMMGAMAQNTITILNGKGFKNEMTFNGQKVVQCVTDTGGWMINPMMGSTAAVPMSAEEAKAVQEQLIIGGPLYEYAKRGAKVELAGKEDIAGTSAYKLKMTGADSVESFFYIDPKTFYLIKMVSKRNIQGQDMDVVAVFSDYQKTDFGYSMPFKTQMTLPQITITTATKKVEVNKPVDPAIFKAG